jgi:hypothetical protein
MGDDRGRADFSHHVGDLGVNAFGPLQLGVGTIEEPHLGAKGGRGPQRLGALLGGVLVNGLLGVPGLTQRDV